MSSSNYNYQLFSIPRNLVSPITYDISKLDQKSKTGFSSLKSRAYLRLADSCNHTAGPPREYKIYWVTAYEKLDMFLNQNDKRAK